MDEHSFACLDFQRVRELLADCAMSSLGRGLALSIRPAAKLPVVKRWLDQVEELRRAEERLGLPPFGGVSDVRELVRRSGPPLRLSVEEMARIGRTLAATHEIAQYAARLPEDSPELHALRSRIGDFASLAARITAVIDERDRVRDDASPKLARIRQRLAEAGEAAAQVVQRMLRDPSVTKYLQYHNHTVHEDRLVLPVRAEYRGRIAGIIHRSSDSGATVYVEPAEAVELNNEIARLRVDESEEINRLLWELAHEVHINADAILGTLDTLAVLDLVCAKLRFARQFELICPELDDQPRLSVRGARHPLLLDLARQRRESGAPDAEVVPIDYRLGDDFQMLIITGPNTGGKTVALKTIGLLSMMAQAGLPLPVAPGSRFGMFSNVLIDVGDEQSLQQSLSTFSAHMRRIMDMLRRANEQTLVLIDELGAGTDPDEGAAIGRAILDELLSRGSRCVVTTHLGALKGYALARRGAENGCVEFDVQTLRPLYRLRIGEPGNSNAIDIAQRLGLPRKIILAARRNLSRKARALQSAIEGTLVTKRRAEAARTAAEDARISAGQARARADEARRQLEKQQADFQEWVRHVVHLRPGDAVRVRNFDRDGRVVRMQLDAQRAEVDVGPFCVEVPLGELLPPQAPPPPARPLPAAPPTPAPRPPRPRPEKRPSGHPSDRASDRVSDRPPGHRADRPAAPGPPPRRPRPRDDGRGAEFVPLSDEQARTLAAGDRIYAKRFHREGRIVRINPQKRLAVVAVGALEMELPFHGLGLPRDRAAAPPAQPAPRARSDADAAPPAHPADAPPPDDRVQCSTTTEPPADLPPASGPATDRAAPSDAAPHAGSAADADPLAGGGAETAQGAPAT